MNKRVKKAAAQTVHVGVITAGAVGGMKAAGKRAGGPVGLGAALVGGTVAGKAYDHVNQRNAKTGTRSLRPTPTRTLGRVGKKPKSM